MKVLDPFAGYRLASGHPIFHVSLFAASFVIPTYLNAAEVLPEYLVVAFGVLRWSHCLLFSLAMFSAYANIDSDIPTEIEAKTQEE